MRTFLRNPVTIVFSIFLFNACECWRFSSKDMKSVLKSLNLSSHLDDVTRRTIEGKKYPDVAVYYFVCNSSLNALTTIDLTTLNCVNISFEVKSMDYSTRLVMLHQMNRYREKVAKGICVNCDGKNQLIVELRWNYRLEQMAVDYIQNCSNSYEKLNEHIEFMPGKKAVRDVVRVSFPMREETKMQIWDVLWTLMSNNHLKDWDDGDAAKFRRNKMSDVGCVFVVVNTVTMKTSTGQFVLNGIVGFLTCVYLTFSTDASFEDQILSAKLTNENCKRMAPQYNFDIDPENIYPALCKIAISKDLGSTTMPCADPSTLGVSDVEVYNVQVNIEDLTELTVYLPVDLPLGVPDPEAINVNCSNRHPEVDTTPDANYCAGFDCDESRLTNLVRNLILKKLNENRELVARGKCGRYCKSNCNLCTNKTYCNIKQLEWHWFLEKKASQIVSKCPTKNKREILSDDSGPFDDPVHYEVVTGVINIPRIEAQISLPEVFAWLFWKNFFFDWNNKYRFRTGSAGYVGCSVVIRPSAASYDVPKAFLLKNGCVTHLTCVFASVNETFNSEIGKPEKNCCNRRNKFLTELKSFGYFKYLCSVNSRDIVTNCEVPCSDDRSKSRAWNFFNFTGKVSKEPTSRGLLTRSYTVQNGSNLFNASVEEEEELFPNEGEQNLVTFEKYMYLDPYEKKYCMIILTFWFLLISLILLVLTLMFKYKLEKQRFLQTLKQ